MSLPKISHSRLVTVVVIAVVIVIVGGLVWGFGQQLVLARQMRSEEVRLEQKVAAEQARNEELAARLAYVRSSEYVEQWARTEMKMTRPGEVVVIVVSDSDDGTGDEPQSSPPSKPESRPFWVELWELIFTPSDR
jgi:cell division protein FtsB